MHTTGHPSTDRCCQHPWPDCSGLSFAPSHCPPKLVWASAPRPHLLACAIQSGPLITPKASGLLTQKRVWFFMFRPCLWFGWDAGQE